MGENACAWLRRDLVPMERRPLFNPTAMVGFLSACTFVLACQQILGISDLPTGGDDGGDAGDEPATCTDTCGCPGQPCCAMNTCANGGCCDVSKHCIAEGHPCSNQLLCQAHACGICGVVGTAACEPGIFCTAPQSAPNGENTCVACGNDGNVCCPDPGGTCAGTLVCAVNGACEKSCGDAGEFCCGKGTCNSGLGCATTGPNTQKCQ